MAAQCIVLTKNCLSRPAFAARLFSPIRDLHGSVPHDCRPRTHALSIADPAGRPIPGDPEGRLCPCVFCVVLLLVILSVLLTVKFRLFATPFGFANLQEKMPLTPSRPSISRVRRLRGAYCREFCSVGDRVVDYGDEEVHGDDGIEGDGVGNGGLWRRRLG
ncbi:hypothetical protein NL676_000204 [Syzygium grande]|nr:hypothetical protein NL676_000204 [Syzygium grande]